MKQFISFAALALAFSSPVAIADDGGDEQGTPPKAEDKKTERAGGEKVEGKGGGLSGADIDFSVSPGKGFIIENKEKTFKLQIRNRVRLRWTGNFVDNGKFNDTFTVESPRTYFSGYAFDKNIQYNFMMQWNDSSATNSPIKEAWVDWWFYNQMDKEAEATIGVRVGQQKQRFGKLATNTSFGQELVDRDIVSSTFSNVRSRGLMLHGHHGRTEKFKDRGNDELFHWNVGMWNRDVAGGFPYASEEGNNPDRKLDFSANFHIDPMGGMGEESYTAGDLEHGEFRATLGGGVYLGKENVGNVIAGAEVDVVNVNTHVGMKANGIHVLGEVFFRDDNIKSASSSPTHFQTWGWVTQASITEEPSKEGGGQWSLALRYAQAYNQDLIPAGNGYAFLTLGLLPGNVSEWTIAVSNYYRKHYLKTQIDFSWIPTNVENSTALDRQEDYRVRVQFTLQI